MLKDSVWLKMGIEYKQVKHNKRGHSLVQVFSNWWVTTQQLKNPCLCLFKGITMGRGQHNQNNSITMGEMGYFLIYPCLQQPWGWWVQDAARSPLQASMCLKTLKKLVTIHFLVRWIGLGRSCNRPVAHRPDPNLCPQPSQPFMGHLDLYKQFGWCRSKYSIGVG